MKLSSGWRLNFSAVKGWSPLLWPAWIGLNPRALPGLAAWYDVSDYSSLVVDGSNRVSLIADKSGNSATNCLCLNGAANQGATSPDSAATSITGDLDLRVWMAPDSWTPSANQIPLSKYNTSSGNHRSYWLRHRTTGAIDLTWSADGSSAITALSTATISAAAYSRLWVRGTLDVDNGAGGWTVRFFTSSDGLTWTQLGADVTGVGVTSIFDGPATVNIGGNDALAFGNFTGKIFRAQIYNGIAGTLVFDANFTTASKLATSFTESSSNAATVTINSSGDLGARICGERDLVQLTASEQPVYLPWSGTNYGYLNGSSSNFFSTPDSAATSLSTELDIVARLNPTTWTPSNVFPIAAKWSASQLSYFFGWKASSKELSLYLSGNGTATSNVFSGTGVPFSDGTAGWVRVTWRASDGRTQFFTAADQSSVPSSWTQLGADQTLALASIFDGTALLTIGYDGNAPRATAGNYFYAEVRSTIGGSAVASFNPALYTSGTTFTASTGEVWTLNGGATIVNRTSVYFDGSDDYMKAAAFSLSQPETVYFTGQQVSWTSNRALWDGNLGGSSIAYQEGSTPNLTLYSGGATNTARIAPALSTSCVLVGVFNGASSSWRFNRNTALNPSLSGNAMNGVTLGSRADGSTSSNILTNEVCIYAAAHDTSVQDRVIQYAGRKWGISGV